MENQQIANYAFQGKYGWHPCDYATFLKLKKLNKYYLEAERKAASWYRWARKSEKNRKGNEPVLFPVLSEKVPYDPKNISWHKVNPVNPNPFYLYEKNTHRPCKTEYSFHIPAKYEVEKKVSKVNNIEWEYFINKHIGYNNSETVVVSHREIIEDYKNARTPRSESNFVVPLTLSVQKIDALLAEIEENTKSQD